MLVEAARAEELQRAPFWENWARSVLLVLALWRWWPSSPLEGAASRPPPDIAHPAVPSLPTLAHPSLAYRIGDRLRYLLTS